MSAVWRPSRVKEGEVVEIEFYSDETLKGLANALVKAGIPRDGAESVLIVLGCANRAAFMAAYGEESVDYPRLDRVDEEQAATEILHENVQAYVNNLLWDCHFTNDESFAPASVKYQLLEWVGLSYLVPRIDIGNRQG